MDPFGSPEPKGRANLGVCCPFETLEANEPVLPNHPGREVARRRNPNATTAPQAPLSEPGWRHSDGAVDTRYLQNEGFSSLSTSPGSPPRARALVPHARGGFDPSRKANPGE